MRATSFSINSDGVKRRWVVPLAHGVFKASLMSPLSDGAEFHLYVPGVLYEMNKNRQTSWLVQTEFDVQENDAVGDIKGGAA